MSIRRIIGLILVGFGIVTLAWGGVFWTDQETVIDVGPLEVQTEEREGFAVPPVVAGVALVSGILLLVLPLRRNV